MPYGWHGGLVSKEGTRSLFSSAGGGLCNLEHIFQLCSSQFACLSKVTLYVRRKPRVQVGWCITLVVVIADRYHRTKPQTKIH